MWGRRDEELDYGMHYIEVKEDSMIYGMLESAPIQTYIYDVVLSNDGKSANVSAYSVDYNGDDLYEGYKDYGTLVEYNINQPKSCVIELKDENGEELSYVYLESSMQRLVSKLNEDVNVFQEYLDKYDELIVGKQNNSTSKINTNPNGVDLKDYKNELPDVWMGELEWKLADKLGTTVKFESDDYDDWTTLCDGAIQIFTSVDNDGYFLKEIKTVDNFYIYGINIGMNIKDAKEVLEAYGFKSDDGEYFVNKNETISINQASSNITEITYSLTR